MNIKGNKIDVDKLVKDLLEVIDKKLADLDKSCMTCDHFEFKSEVCKLANARPPARVIANGCSSYKEEIPF